MDTFLAIRRLLLGNHFIEGYWFEVVYLASEEKTIHFGAIIKITYVDSSYSISGESFNNGKYEGTFNSRHSLYNNYKLKYSWEGMNTEVFSDIIGNAELTFTPGEKDPQRFVGSLFSSARNGVIRIVGLKINEADINGKDINNPRGKEELVTSLMDTFLNNNRSASL